ncbi:mucin-19-like isoform X2 [Corticium candelabrum]|uniref:mucin-19-like isoform X2 n=1 Tax=Corticium candelabrum TaxID=121492 RepID=UPI002E2602DF|nr:mucin-19-like isoform X2 [Corticium candelabrum]XP_062520177.1 mucin-19-like isoform X2 [Corticium candelabrum]
MSRNSAVGRTQFQSLLFLLSLNVLATYGTVAEKAQQTKICSETALKSAQMYCNVIAKTGQPYGACHPYVDPTEQYNLCIRQICECSGDESCGCSAVRDYESQCRNVGEDDLDVGTIADECGVCYGNGSSCKYSECTVFSTPPASLSRSKQKYVTFDCLVHEFQGSCEYTLARDCTGGLFDIHIENNSPVPNAIRTAWTRGIAIRAAGLGTIRATFSDQNTTVYMNSKLLSWLTTNHGIDGSQVVLTSEGQQHKVEIILATSKVKISLVGQHKITVSVPSSFRNHMCGLCGNNNGNSNDDLMLPSGKSLSVKAFTSSQFISNYHTFGVSWAALGKNRMILKSNSPCSDPSGVPYCDQKLKYRKKVEKFCRVIIDSKGPFATCHAYTNPEWVYNQCVRDVCLHSGNTQSGCPTIRLYQAQCQKCDKTFSATVAKCNKLCSIPAAPANGFTIGNGRAFHDVVKFSCNRGFILQGYSSRQCQADGTWTGSLPFCTDIDECAAGTHNCDSQAKCANTYGSFTCTCNSCYRGNGVTCTSKRCSMLEAPLYGSVSSRSNLCGKRVMFQCYAGYRLQGVSSIQCRTNSLWSRTQPVCKDIDECSTGDHICNVRARCNNTIGGYSCHCNDGYLGDGLTCDRRVYTVTGIVKDASTGKGIVRSIVSLGGRSTRTNSSGYFTFTNVPCLPYTLTAIGPGYVSNSKNVTVSEEGPDCVMANIVLSKELTSGTWKVVITWGAEARDLDAYMEVPGGCRVSYDKNHRYCFSGTANVSLDNDDRDRFGPETITIHEGVAVGTYKHYVHVYSDDLTFALCKATAELYNGDAKVSTIQSPSGNHHYWDTFTIDTAKRRFHAVNRLRQ